MGRKRKIEEIDGFFRITVRPDHPRFKEEEALLNALNRTCRSDEIHFSFENDLVCAYLASLDPDGFINILNGFREKTGAGLIYQEKGYTDPFEGLLTRILSIGSYGIRYGKRLYIGYADERKVQDRKDKAATRGLHFYASDNSFSHIRNDIPEGYLNSIICGDSEEIMANLPDNCIDLIITSPPYNFGMQYGKIPMTDWSGRHTLINCTGFLLKESGFSHMKEDLL